MEVNGIFQVWLPTFFKIFVFVFSRRSEIHTGLKQLEGEKIQNFLFWVEYPFKLLYMSLPQCRFLSIYVSVF